MSPAPSAPEGHAGHGVRGLAAVAGAQVQAAVDLVAAAGEQAEVLRRLLLAGRLAEHAAVDHDHGVDAEDELARRAGATRASTSSALPRALRSTVRTGSPSCRSSSCALTTTRNGMPSWRSSASRCGEREARTSLQRRRAGRCARRARRAVARRARPHRRTARSRGPRSRGRRSRAPRSLPCSARSRRGSCPARPAPSR